uniref:Uncharacterized protein n=1 Tax=Strongyloides stercoralis TaxID=6248 RepID=A0A0K0E362_STRER
MIRSGKADVKDKKPKDNYIASTRSKYNKVSQTKDLQEQKETVKKKKPSWTSTFIYVNPHVHEPLQIDVFSTMLNKKIFGKIFNYAQTLAKKKQDQEALDEMLKAKKNSFSLGDLFPSSRLFRKKNKNTVEAGGERKLVASLRTKEIHPYHSMSTKDEMKKHPNVVFQPNKFSDYLFNQNGHPPWINDLGFEDSENSESETDNNLNIDSELIIELYNDRLRLVAADHEPQYTMNPFKDEITTACELDFLFKWEYIVSNTIRSLVGIVEEKETKYSKVENKKRQNNSTVSFKSLPTYYLAFNRIRPYKKYVKVPYKCNKTIKVIEKEIK